MNTLSRFHLQVYMLDKQTKLPSGAKAVREPNSCLRKAKNMRPAESTEFRTRGSMMGVKMAISLS